MIRIAKFVIKKEIFLKTILQYLLSSKINILKPIII